jgi:uncharacterized protein YrrD
MNEGRLEMIKGSQLVGRAVIDMEAAQRLGRIKEIILQHDGERVAGFVAVHGETIVGTGGTRRAIPASALHSIGPDAITVRGTALKERPADLDKLPRMSDVIGHKMVTQSGRLLGSIDDVLINGTDGSIVGYVVGEGVRGKVENFFNPQRSRIHGYVRADADLKVGDKLIVVPDDALIEEEPVKDGNRRPAMGKIDKAEFRGWRERTSTAESTESSIWTRGTDPATHNTSRTPPEPPLQSETARPVESTRPTASAEDTAFQTSRPHSAGEAVTNTPHDQGSP